MIQETDQVEIHIRRTAATDFFNSMKRAVIIIGGYKFLAHVADTDAQKSAGLEVAMEIEDNEGMLFPFESPDHVTFHMGSVKFPLDIIFLLEDAEGLRINKIIHDVQPGDEQHYSDHNVAAVLELKGGTCKRCGIRRGDLCELKTRMVAAQSQIEVIKELDRPWRVGGSNTCSHCQSKNAYYKEFHPDTSINEIALYCPDCGFSMEGKPIGLADLKGLE